MAAHAWRRVDALCCRSAKSNCTRLRQPLWGQQRAQPVAPSGGARRGGLGVDDGAPGRQVARVDRRRAQQHGHQVRDARRRAEQLAGGREQQVEAGQAVRERVGGHRGRQRRRALHRLDALQLGVAVLRGAAAARERPGRARPRRGGAPPAAVAARQGRPVCARARRLPPRLPAALRPSPAACAPPRCIRSYKHKGHARYKQGVRCLLFQRCRPTPDSAAADCDFAAPSTVRILVFALLSL